MPEPHQLYLVVDRSAPMAEAYAEAPSRWDATVEGITAFVNAEASTGSAVAVQYFGQPDTCDLSAYRTPAVPMGELPAVAPEIIASLASVEVGGSTPIAPALQGALEHLVEIASADTTRIPAVVLIVSAFPDECGVHCNVDDDCSNAACVGGVCDSGQSIADLAHLAERHSNEAPWVRTHVIAVAQGLANLQIIPRAARGGEYTVVADVAASVEQALHDVSRVSSCSLRLTVPPEESVDASFLNVIDDGRPIPFVPGPERCDAAAGDAWYLASEDAPLTAVVCPARCATLTAPAFQLGCERQAWRAE